MTETYKLVFEKLSEANTEMEKDFGDLKIIESTYKEIEEIAELKKVVLETVETQEKLYTTT